VLALERGALLLLMLISLKAGGREKWALLHCPQLSWGGEKKRTFLSLNGRLPLLAVGRKRYALPTYEDIVIEKNRKRACWITRGSRSHRYRPGLERCKCFSL